MKHKATINLLVMLVISMMEMCMFRDAHARDIIEPVRCQQDAPCPCKPPTTLPARKYWTCDDKFTRQKTARSWCGQKPVKFNPV